MGFGFSFISQINFLKLYSYIVIFLFYKLMVKICNLNCKLPIKQKVYLFGIPHENISLALLSVRTYILLNSKY